MIGHFGIVQEEENRDEAEKTSLPFPFYKERKMQICPRSLVFVLLFLHNPKVTHGQV